MKVILGATLLWILARHEFHAYLSLATTNAPKPVSGDTP